MKEIGFLEKAHQNESTDKKGPKIKIGFLDVPEQEQANQQEAKPKCRIGFISEFEQDNFFAAAETLEELSQLKNIILEEIREQQISLAGQWKGDMSEYDKEWNSFYNFFHELYGEREKEIMRKTKIGFLSSSTEKNPFFGAKNQNELQELWDKKEKDLNRRHQEQGDKMNYVEEWKKLFELYKEVGETIVWAKKTKKGKLGFLKDE